MSYFCDIIAFNVRIQLFEQVTRVFSPVTAQMLIFQEEVDT